MWTSEMRRIFQAGVVVLALGLSASALAQQAPAEEPAAAPAAEAGQSLRQAIEKRYRVLPIRNGVVLTPRQERLGVQTIEVSGDTIAVNGERVTEGVVRAWLAEDADLILRLRRLPAQQRQALFGLQTGATPGSAAGEADAVEEEAAPVVVEDEEGEVEIPAEGEVPPIPGAPEPPEAPEVPEGDDPGDTGPATGTSGSVVKFLGDITVEKGELAEEAVTIGGSIRIDGEVSRDVQSVGGSVTINGTVGGDVTAVGGNIRLGPEAVVDGDVASVGGTVFRAEGARVHGKTSEVVMSPGGRGWEDGGITFHPWSPFVGNSFDLLWQLVTVVLLALLVWLCILLVRRPMERVERYVATEPWMAGVVGFLAQLLFLPLLAVVTVLLAITVVGCALFLLYPFLFLFLALAAILGYAAVAHRLGRFLEARFNWNLGASPYAAALVGVIAIEVWSLLGRLLGVPNNGWLEFISFLVLAFGFAAQYIAWTVGFGAVLMARFGRDPGPLQPTMVVSPPPPPAPSTPVVYEPAEELAPERPWEPAPPEPER